MSPKESECSGLEVPRPDHGNIVPNAGDIVILVMGLTGSGKSTFINAIVGRDAMVVGYEMESCTTNIATTEVDVSKFPHFQWLQNRRLILVDTPGFDDTYTNEPDILKQIGEWLGASYRDKVVVGGLVHLHDISVDRFTGTARKSLVVFNQLCGEDALNRVVLGTTKSSRLHPDEATKRQARLKDVHWKQMIDKGARVFRLDEADSAQAWEIVNAVLERFKPEEISALCIQRELVDEKKSIEQTLAWTTAYKVWAAWTANLGNLWRADRRRGQVEN